MLLSCALGCLVLWTRVQLALGSSTRVYFIAAVEREWDYAPGELNRIKGTPLYNDSQAIIYTQRGATRLGTQYKKIIYREFTDDTFTQEKPHPPHLGFLGPVLKGEEGDTIKVHFKNLARRPFSVHSHGVFYDKASEGAVYADHSKNEVKKDDQVPPGEVHVYTWLVNEEHAPTAADGDCVTRMYHSHVISVKDTNTGLIGILLICKAGALMENSDKRRNIDREFPILFTLMDENKSWLLDDNIEHFTSDPEATKNLKGDGGFQTSNELASINGFMYGNLPGLNMCHGDVVSWHMIGLGTWQDMHDPSFHGHTVKINSHRADTTTLLPSTFKTAYMDALNPGTWLLNCMDNRFFEDGMSALFNVSGDCGNGASPPTVSGGMTRTYYIAAEEVTWDYGPTGFNNMDGKPLTAPGSESAKYFVQSDTRLGGRYKKALYVEYIDGNFTIKKNRSVDEAHLGFLGPVIRTEVGDVIKVFFKNKASRNYSIHPLGVFYDKANEGAMYQDNTSGNDTADNSIMPNETFMYRWTVPEEVAPTESDPQCLTWMYHSGVDPTKDKHTGLVGPLLTCKRGTLDENGQQKNIDHEYIMRFGETLEAMSWYFDENKNMSSNSSQIDENDAGFQTSNKMKNINGYMFGNLPGLRMCKGDAVSWHLIGGRGTHSAYFYGNTFTNNGNNHDTLGMIPGSLATLHMTPDNPGVWKLVSRVNSDLNGGMSAKYTVRKDCGQEASGQRGTGKMRWHYIAAVEETWDYAPSGDDLIEGVPLNESEYAAPYTVAGPKYIGRRNKKVLYREFTDATFTVKKVRSDDERHLGIMGPMIKAEVGDTIEILFKNLATRYFSMHPHGIFYSKNDEGSSYQDNTTGADTADNAIAPGRVYNYVWEVPERAGPGANNTACLAWGYYSDVNPVKDTNSGLMGPLVICKKGTLNENNKRTDVDREFAVVFVTLDENESWFLNENKNTYLTGDPGADFWSSNLKASINGYLYGNLPGLHMYQHEKVVWYLLQIGGFTEMHTVHFHGQSVLYRSTAYHRGDVYDLMPESFAVVDMTPDAIGTWMLHCHVNIHTTTGMRALFTVSAPTDEPSSRPPRRQPPTAGCSRLTGHVILLSSIFVLFLLA